MLDNRSDAKKTDPDRAGQTPSRHEAATDRTKDRENSHDTLDKALEDSFPASDPVSVTQPGK